MEGEGEERDRVMTMTEKPKRREVGGGGIREEGERKKGNLTSLDTHMANDLLLLGGVFFLYYLLVKYFLDPFRQKRKRKCSLTSFKMTTFYPRPLSRTHLF